MKGWLRGRLAEQAVSGRDLDDPDTTLHHADLIRSKPILRDFYEGVYGFFAQESQGLPPGRQVELGSGGGFVKERLPQVETSDVMPLPGLDLCFSALDMPFEPGSLASVYMLDVLHHLPDAGRFFDEAVRCLAPGGKLVMVEPANTLFGRFIYRNFHHEPFEPGAPDWRLPEGGPMSMANGALPWIVFVRDRARFQAGWPTLQVTRLDHWAPFRYLASGGVSMRQIVPTPLYPVVKAVEAVTAPLHGQLGMFMRVVVERRAETDGYS